MNRVNLEEGLLQKQQWRWTLKQIVGENVFKVAAEIVGLDGWSGVIIPSTHSKCNAYI